MRKKNVSLAIGLTSLLSGCFQVPTSSQGSVSVLDSATRVVAMTSVSENKALARIDAANKVATNLPAPSGQLSGSSITVPAGALMLSADLVIEEAIPLSQTSVASSLQLDSSNVVTAVGSGLIIRPTEAVNLSQPLTIAMSLTPSAGLWSDLNQRFGLAASKNYAVFYKQFIDGELRAGVIPSGDLSFREAGVVEFSGYFGSYWLVEVSIPIVEPQEVKTDEPLVNINQVAVIEKTGIVTEQTIQTKTEIPPVLWSATELSASATRVLQLKGRLASSDSLKECKADLYPSVDATNGLQLAVNADLSVVYAVEDTLAHTYVGRLRCLDSNGRQTMSPWSNSLSLVALKPLVLARSPLLVKEGSVVTLLGQNFRRTMSVKLAGQAVLGLQVLSDTKAIFTVPGGLSLGWNSMAYAQDGASQVANLLYQAGAAELPVITLPPSEVCAGQSYYNAAGLQQTGSKTCAAFAACTADGATNCTATPNFPAAAATGLAAKVLSGTAVAGVSGSVLLPPAAAVRITAGGFGPAGGILPLLADCASDGQAGCVAVGPSFAAGLITGAGGKIIAGQSLAGVAGTVSLPPVGRVLTGTSFGPGATAQGGTSMGTGGTALGGTSMGTGGMTLTGTSAGGTALEGTLTLPLAANVKIGTAAYGVPGSLTTPSYSPDFPALANVRSVATSNGMTGTLADCTAANQSGCYANASFKTMDISMAGAAAALNSSNFATVIKGTGNFEFWDGSGNRHMMSGDSDLNPASIVAGTTIFGISGTATPAPAPCAGDGSQSCVATGTYFAANACGANSSNCYVPPYISSVQPLKAINYESIAANQNSIRASLTLAGISGTLSDCSNGNQVACVTTNSYRSMDLSIAGGYTALTSANFNTTVRSAGNFEYWDATGTRQVGTGDTMINPANIKNGVGFLGVSGQYPSVTYPLPSSSATADLTNSTFNIQIKNSAAFEYWTSSGVYQTGSGDDDIASPNLVNGINIFGASGTVPPPECSSNTQATCQANNLCVWNAGTCAINLWNVRAGTTIAGTTGQLKTNCINRANSSLFNIDGTAIDTGSVSGSVVDWWDTIDDKNNAGLFPSQLVASSNSLSDCSQNVWKDDTIDGACDSAADDCVMRDNISALQWTESSPNGGTAPTATGATWATAVNNCENLVYGSHSDWRLPTQKEVMTAYVHGIKQLVYANTGTIRPGGNTLDNNDLFVLGSASSFWSSTTSSISTANGWKVALGDGTTAGTAPKTTAYPYLCVRQAP